MARSRVERQPLTRATIIDAALRHADAGGLSNLTIRSLAAELDVSAMALYRHVRDKDDLLLSVVDALLARASEPDTSLDWTAYVGAQATSLRAILHREPALAGLYGRRPVTTPAALARLSGALKVLEDAGFAPADALDVFAAVHTYTLGFCLLEIGRATAGVGLPPSPDPLARAIEAFVSEEQFRHGLDAVIRGHVPPVASGATTNAAG